MRHAIALAAALLTLPHLAQADVVNGTFAATATDGEDTTGVFGPRNTNLANAAISGSYSIDTSLLSSSLVGTTDTYTGSPGALTVTVTIGGLSYSFTDPTYSAIVLDSSTGDFSLQAANFTGTFSANISLNATFGPGVIPDSTDPTLSFAGSALLMSSGGFAVIDGDPNSPTALAAADFTLAALTNGQPVPEPASLALVFSAVGCVIMQRCRSKSAPRLSR